MKARTFTRGDIHIECEAGSEITIRKGRVQLDLSIAQAHFLASRLPEAVREALYEKRPA